eukprot:Selendium_serpulae@DN6408_c1_g1_i4.p1
MVLKYLTHFRDNWHTDGVMKELMEYGIPTSGGFPDTSNLRFVQLDEFFPMPPTHRNSFCNYIRNYYLPLLKIKPENYHSIDLYEKGVVTVEEIEREFPDGLFTQKQFDSIDTNPLMKRVHKFCEDYEAKIREMGGIDFFLGGIGPDGHIAFNMPGSTADSKTRLVKLNYMTAAHAASDLGGIERAVHTAAITIGLGTITYKKDATIIIMAAGEGKGKTIEEAVCNPVSDEFPATHLRSVPGTRFYVSKGASKYLNERYADNVMGEIDDAAEEPIDCRRRIDKACDYSMYEHAIKSGKAVTSFPHTEATQTTNMAEHLIKRGNLKEGAGKAAFDRIQTKLNGGLSVMDGQFSDLLEYLNDIVPYDMTSKQMTGPHTFKTGEELRILHTAPHHDDIMLSYHPTMKELLARANVKNRFVYLTSGFHSVTDTYISECLDRVLKYKSKTAGFIKDNERLVFKAGHPELVAAFARAHKASDNEKERDIEAIMVIRHIIEINDINIIDRSEACHRILVALAGTRQALRDRVPGDATPKDIQMLKGMVRETEAEKMWALRDVPARDVHHLRSKFYTDDYFTPLPTIEHDAMPLVALMEEFKPHLVTVAFDPEGTGPDTHYKVLQVVAEAVKIISAQAEQNLREGRVEHPTLPIPHVWGYRNVWFRFEWHDCNIIMPVAAEQFAELHDAFMSCFVTQKNASFPSPYYEGPFSEWAIQTLRKQHKQFNQIMGADFAANHKDPRVKNASGYILIKQMTAAEFAKRSRELKELLGFN